MSDKGLTTHARAFWQSEDNKCRTTTASIKELKKGKGKEKEKEKEKDPAEQKCQSLGKGGFVPRASQDNSKLEIQEEFTTINIGGLRGQIPEGNVLSAVIAWLPPGRSSARSQGCITFLIKRFGGKVVDKLELATHVISDKPPKAKLPSSVQLVHSDWLLYKLLPTAPDKTEEDFNPLEYVPTPSFSKWGQADMNIRCVLRGDELFAHIVENWTYDARKLQNDIFEDIEMLARVFGYWKGGNEDLIKQFIDAVLVHCFKELGRTDEVINTEQWLESLNITMGHGPVEYVVTYQPPNSLPILLIVEAKQILDEKSLPQVIGELLCVHSLNQKARDARRDVYAILTNMSEWQFFCYDGSTTFEGEKEVAVIYHSPVLPFIYMVGPSVPKVEDVVWRAHSVVSTHAVLKLLLATIEETPMITPSNLKKEQVLVLQKGSLVN